MTQAPVSFYDFQVKDIQGNDFDLGVLRGKVALIVNTASKCGFTPQFDGLEALWKQYGDQGLVVLGFPCNQFGGQDPGSHADIASFCRLNHGVSFPMMTKVEVNGPQSHPLYQWLKKQAPGVLGSQAIKWNFTKFLLGRDGRIIHRYGSINTPQALKSDIERALGSH